MNHAIVLAMIPLPLLAWASWPQEQPVEIRTVQSEGIRAQRQDTETFTSRWRPVYLAPMRNEVRAIGAPVAGPRGEASASANRDDDLMFAPAMTYREVPVETVSVRPQPPPAVRIVRRAALLRRDICAKHGMHRVTYGKRWRCRK